MMDIKSIEKFDIFKVLEMLWKKERKVFHGEIDFQFELMNAIKEYYNTCIVRAGHPFKINGRRKYVDILITDENNKKGIIVELKYKTENKKNNKIKINSETYILGNQGAKDDSSYYILKDIEKIEKIIDNKNNDYGIHIIKGYVIFITNDKTYMENKISGKAENVSLNRINDEFQTRNFKENYTYYRTNFSNIELSKKEHIGIWIELEKFADDEEKIKNKQLYELIFEIKE